MLPTAPIRQTITRICPECKDKFEAASTTARVCYSCWLARQIRNLQKYQYEEQYSAPTKAYPISRATRTPKTGSSILDEKKTILWDIFHNSKDMLSLRRAEQEIGLDHREYWSPECHS